MTLLANQQMIGSSVALTVNTITVLPATNKTTWITTALATDAITLSSGNTVRGFGISGTTGFHIANTATASVGALTINSVSLDGTGSLFRADSGGALAVTFDTASTASAPGNGIQLGGATTGTFTATTGAISGVSGTDVLISGGTATVTIGSSITGNTGGTIDINGHTTGNITFSGALNITGGTGISVQNVTS